ncbi:hypothetical protein F5B22DRAFT_85391 [Xylaria bambusicola]|uniref:uncharacterized protein n=1 Tax=Xylaria bambusicola TaxID=326684 RepID=UPI00200735F4|nr:uncharacterized protein F5B22DRAFT_85391 [Xylaria bambusicola]KAI0517952.1 hypothetical protein F5B22DRAFT_85391 [Xylaria bambusicola]
MRFSVTAVTAALLFASSGPLALVSASADAEPKPDTTPDSTPTKTTQQQIKPRETTPNLLSALYQIATEFGLRACIPQALPLVTTLPKIPPGLLVGGAVSQALTQSTRELEDVCEFSVTGSVGDTFTSFLPTWYEWYNKYSDRIQSVVTRCPKAAKLVSTVEAYQTCPQVLAQITAADTSTATTAGDGGNGELSETATETETTGAAHETGILGAAAGVAAGLLGIAAVL